MSRGVSSAAVLLGAALALPTVAVSTPSFDEPDELTERCLSEGEILRGRRSLEGVTSPERITLVCDGEERFAVMKCFHDIRLGVKHFDDGTWEFNFTDSYRYERPAYLLDRALGLEFVPVAVFREIRGRECALIEWIYGTSYEKDSPHDPTGTERALLAQRKKTMRLFDALVYNTDRNTQNLLLDDEDWRLYLIDHSRAFRERSNPPPDWMKVPARLSRDLYDRLRALDKASLTELFEGHISESRIDALLNRRDEMIEKIDRDRKRFGDQAVFVDLD